MEIANKNKSRKKKNVGLVDHMLVYQVIKLTNLHALEIFLNLRVSSIWRFTPNLLNAVPRFSSFKKRLQNYTFFKNGFS